jgi:hypothetical protein
MTFDPETGGAMQDILAVAARKIAFGKTAVINGIEQVSFANAIRAADANNPFGKRELHLPVIFKLGERYGIQK